MTNIRVYLSEFKLYVCNNVINKIPWIALRMLFYRKIMGFEIGSGSYIFMGCTFDAARGLKIGQNSVINANCRIDTRGGITIGDNVSISNDTILLTADHDMDSPNMEGRSMPMHIDDYVWIGTRAMLMPGANVGFGAVVAAGALANKNVEPYQVVGGVPAKFLKFRNKDVTFTYNASFKRMFQ